MLIEYKNVNIYQQDNMVLSNVDFHVDEGEFTVRFLHGNHLSSH